MTDHADRVWKIPESVLVVIYTPALDVLLIRRADADEFWQSVTGSKDALDEPTMLTAAREVGEETGIDCGEGSALAAHLVDWGVRNVYEIYPQWLGRYAPGTRHNTEHLFGLCVPERLTPTLAPREHTAWQWLPYRDAADACFSPSNAEAILLLPQFVQ
ncbi:MAG: dihydroneopterin triphosphate diphosphatase [Variovorax sp.]|nr:dihydroneopterin triphosphate diphosphatase [Variovorax sp.]